MGWWNWFWGRAKGVVEKNLAVIIAAILSPVLTAILTYGVTWLTKEPVKEEQATFTVRSGPYYLPPSEKLTRGQSERLHSMPFMEKLHLENATSKPFNDVAISIPREGIAAITDDHTGVVIVTDFRSKLEVPQIPPLGAKTIYLWHKGYFSPDEKIVVSTSQTGTADLDIPDIDPDEFSYYKRAYRVLQAIVILLLLYATSTLTWVIAKKILAKLKTSPAPGTSPTAGTPPAPAPDGQPPGQPTTPPAPPSPTTPLATPAPQPPPAAGRGRSQSPGKKKRKK